MPSLLGMLWLGFAINSSLGAIVICGQEIAPARVLGGVQHASAARS